VRPGDAEFVRICTLRDGLVETARHYFSDEELLRELGVIRD
jgi:hypothetical protein